MSLSSSTALGVQLMNNTVIVLPIAYLFVTSFDTDGGKKNLDLNLIDLFDQVLQMVLAQLLANTSIYFLL